MSRALIRLALAPALATLLLAPVARGLPRPVRAEPAPERALTVLWAGDVHLGRGVAEGMARPGRADPFAAIKPLLAQADLRVANLEGQLTTAPRANGGYYLTGEPRHVGLLAGAGLDLLSLANNHATDNGREGLA